MLHTFISLIASCAAPVPTPISVPAPLFASTSEPEATLAHREPQESEAPALGQLPDDLGLPKSTEAEAEALWRQMLLSVGAGLRNGQPVDSFEAPIEVLARQQDSLGNPAGMLQTNIRVKYLALEDSGREYIDFSYEGDARLIFGPSGYWLVERGKRTPLRGREHKESRQRVMQTKALARNFSHLSDLLNLQVVELRKVDGPAEGQIPRIAGVLPSRFQWLELVTPDFEVTPRESSERNAGKLYTVLFGIERQGKGAEARYLPRFLHIRERLLGQSPTAPSAASGDPSKGGADNPPPAPAGAPGQSPSPSSEPARELFIDVRNFVRQGQLVIPQRMNLYERTPGLIIGRDYGREPGQEVFLLEGLRLDAPLSQAHFDPTQWGDPAHSGR